MDKRAIALAVMLACQPALADKLKCKQCVDTRDIAKGAIKENRLDKSLRDRLADLEQRLAQLETKQETQLVSQYIDDGLTVKDTGTGLTWVKLSAKDGVQDYNNLTDVDNAYTWVEAQDAVQGLRRAVYGGFNDWRLPTLSELESLLYAPEPCLGRPFSVCVADSSLLPASDQYYWTSTGDTYVIFFANGHISITEKVNRFRVRAVR